MKKINRTPPSLLRTFYASFLLVMVLVIVAGIGFSALSNYRISSKLIANYNKEQLDDATQTADALKMQVENVKEQLQYIAQIDEIRSLDPKVCNAKIEYILKGFEQNLGNIGRIGPNGVFYCSGNKALLGTKGSAFGQYITDIFNDPEHKPVMSRMIYPKGATSYLLAIHVPVYDAKGAFAGTVGGAIDVNQLAEHYLKNVRIGETGFVSVVDDNGDIIYNANKSFIGKNRYSEEIQNANGHSQALNNAFETAKLGTHTLVRYKTNGQERMAAMTSVEVLPGRRWVVYGVVPMSDVARGAQDFGLHLIYRRLIIVYSLALMIVASLVLLFMRRRVFGPVHQLEVVANKVQAGDLKSRVHLKRQDELGRLGKSFNDMLEEINNYHKDLEKQVISKTHQLSNALNQSQEKNKSLEDTKRAMLNVMSDLAEEKDKLKTESTRIEAMFQSMGDALVVTDQYSKIVQLNPVAEKLLGVKSQDVVGKWYPDVVYLYNQDKTLMPPDQRPIAQAIESGKAIRSRDYYLGSAKSKTILPISLTVSPLILNNQPLGVVEVFRDITQERELEEAKDDFVSLVSHQLRTPATAVKQFLGMIKEGYAGKVTPEQDDFINTAYESNERQIGIIDDLLNVSRLDLGRLKANLQPTDITELVKSIYQIMVPKAAERKQKITLEASEAYIVPADANMLRMAIENFIDNASKYTPDGGSIKVSVTKHGKTVSIAVADTGVGIAEKDIKKLYKKFSRIDNSLSVERGGSGLGLYIAHQIVELHKGKLVVSSKLGKGTTFTIQLKQE